MPNSTSSSTSPFFRLWLIAFASLLIQACESPTSAVFAPVEEEIPEAQPCGGECPENYTCAPVINDQGEPEFACLPLTLRYCAPCVEDSDCQDPGFPNHPAVCVYAGDSEGSFCSTGCDDNTQCPVGSYCAQNEDGGSYCEPESGACDCSEWAIENGATTTCLIANGEGTCQGSRTCTDEGLSECDAPIPAAEVCNGLDDNCNGEVDETYPELGQSCDGEDSDLCADGTLFCEEGALFCGDDAESVTEVCNGLDDDCDGLADEELEIPEASLVEGVCAELLQSCGGTDGWQDPDFSSVDGFEETEVTCDDLDNDCDGEVDERYSSEGPVRYLPRDGGEGLYKGQDCGFGACEGGSVICGDDGESLICSSDDAIEGESCDGIDNDCDGQIDEDLSIPEAQLNTGVCAGSEQICDGEGGFIEPDYFEIETYEFDESLCDGLDNDCDGDVDEAFLEGGNGYTAPDGSVQYLGDSCGLGACQGGTVVCSETGLGLECSSNTGAAAEICDGIDNDCDGLIDEVEDMEAPLVDMATGVCSAVQKVCAGVDGWIEPLMSDVAGYEAEELSCDGLDNDCDGLIDEGLEAPLAQNQQGVCGGTRSVCAGVDGWVEPDYATVANYEAVETRCDGFDNDCDGLSDEDLGAPLAAKQEGVCAGLTKVCDGQGGWAEPNYFTVNGYQQEETWCDGLDNDCDGMEDELYGPNGVFSYSDLDGTTGLTLGESCGVGQCGGGTVVCGGLQSLTCSTLENVSGEVCDGLDNDCDGSIDDSLSAPVAGLSQGVCSGQVKVCGGVSGWQEPDYTVISGYASDDSVCDGLDNDCDGLTDEDVILPAAAKTEGVCAGLTQVCDGVNGLREPDYLAVANYATSDSICDGLDNDCDGLTDEELGDAPVADNQSGICAGATKVCDGTSGWVNPDYSAIAGYSAADDVCDGIDSNCSGAADEDVVLPVADKTSGVCQGLTKVCAGAAGLVEPNYGDLIDYASTDSVCDGLDNDCDGLTDEDLGESPVAGNQLGVCAGSTKVCAGFSGWVNPDYSLIPNYNVDDSVCDGLDNDCDGEVDEEVALPAADLTAGVCEGQVQVCDGANGLIEPTYTDIDGYQVDETLCDGIDNDCDGTSDDPYRAGGNRPYVDPVSGQNLYLGDSCGTGSCNGGTVQCSGLGVSLECSSSGNAGVEVCDGIDNDCDGLVDEDLVGALTSRQIGICVGARLVCAGAAGWVEPDLTQIAGYELEEASCDGQDNDCDGQTDEGLSFTAPLADNQNGVCSGAKKQCMGSSGWQNPNYATHSVDYQSTETWCDGLDNDCDGFFDENHTAGGGVTYTDLNGTTGLTLGQSCGVGACGGGTVVCGSVNTLACTTIGNATSETCDSQDNDCDGQIDETFDLDSDEFNCGSCGTICAEPAGTVSACVAGTCAVTDCIDDTYEDCDGVLSNGCETDLLNDDNNCGACGNACDLANSSSSCNGAGDCGVDSCDPGYCDANTNPGDGCEVPLAASNACEAAIDVGSIRGDYGDTIELSGGYGSVWYRVYVDEGYDLPYDLSLTISLYPGAGTDYDLLVRQGSCSDSIAGSYAAGTAMDAVRETWGDSWGSDDGKFIYFKVDYYSGNTCSPWTIFIEGDT